MTPHLVQMLGLTVPLVQAPMAGTSTPALAAAVSESGGLGSIAIGTLSVAAAKQAIEQTRALTSRPFNVNVFCHRPPERNAAVERAWCDWLAPVFARFDAVPPTELREIYPTFVDNAPVLAMLLEVRPAVVSFHFGLPSGDFVQALKSADILTFSTATTLAEAIAAVDLGVDAIVAQGYEAGGHRGVFDPDAADEALATLPLVRLLAGQLGCPIIAAGGLMDGNDIAEALAAGAQLAQLGTAFIACPESAADAAYRETLFSDAARHTRMTQIISGRPARCLANAMTDLDDVPPPVPVPAYPVAYDAGKALHAAASRKGDFRYGAQWAGQGAPRARAMPAGELVRRLAAELQAAGQVQ